MEMKPIWASKTAILNVIVAIAAIGMPSAGEFIKQNPEGVAVAWSVVNILMRLMTKDKVIFW